MNKYSTYNQFTKVPFLKLVLQGSEFGNFSFSAHTTNSQTSACKHPLLRGFLICTPSFSILGYLHPGLPSDFAHVFHSFDGSYNGPRFLLHHTSVSPVLRLTWPTNRHYLCAMIRLQSISLVRLRKTVFFILSLTEG